MKTKCYILITMLFFSSSSILFAQSGLKIESGGRLTVNGNLTIIPSAFVCGNPMTDTRDGKTYNTVQIGTQCWFAQNINVGAKINGSGDQTNNGMIEKFCYNNDDANCAIYGGLYQWNEMMNYVTTEGTQGICPTGWHLPTDAEWTSLSSFLGGANIAGGKLKEAGTTHWAVNVGGTNSSGFTALPSGYWYGYDGFDGLLIHTYIWSSTQQTAGAAWSMELVGYNELAFRSNIDKITGVSIRCIRD